jgi:hypothetical protein
VTVRLTSTGIFKPVNYQTPMSAIFEFSFATGIEEDIKKFDNHIQRGGFFSFKTGKGIVFIGRLKKTNEQSNISFYTFIVDNITLSTRLERLLHDQSSDVPASRQDKG